MSFGSGLEILAGADICFVVKTV